MRCPLLASSARGVTPQQLNRLNERLALPANILSPGGYVQYTDTEAFQRLPTLPLGDPGQRDEDEGELQAEVLLFDQINQIKVLEDAAALNLTRDALAHAGLFPPSPYDAAAEAVHSRFEAVDGNGAILSDVAIDTKVRYSLRLGGLPVVGSGGKVSLTYDAAGKVTHLNYSLRRLAQAAPVALLPQATADEMALAAYQSLAQEMGAKLSFTSQMVYYAPPPELSGVQLILPHYQYDGTLTPANGGQPIQLRSILVPAVTSSNLVPSARLILDVGVDYIAAAASVSGGRAPYTYMWNSSSTVLTASNQSFVSYKAPSGVNETLTLVVIDANGITATASTNIVVSGQVGQRPNADFLVNAVGPLDVGTEWIGMSPTMPGGSSANAGGFVNRIRASGGAVGFNWGERNAWERDFKDPTLGGNDISWVDNVDAVFYTGHANDDGWVFTSDQDDRFLHYSEARYGQGDLEWLVIAACGPLQDGVAPNRWWERWGPAFQRLHLLCGYDDISWDNVDEGRKWADYMLRGWTVRQAWICTGIEVQWRNPEKNPNLKVAVMGVFDRNGVSNWNDHYWGRGWTGPDIPSWNLGGWWKIATPVD